MSVRSCEIVCIDNLFPACSIIQSKNIKDILLLKPGKNHSNSNRNGCFFMKSIKRYNFCQNYFKETLTFANIKPGKVYQIKQTVNCISKNIIYLITCKKCSVQYIGSASTPKVRFRSHKSSMRTNKKTCEVAIHFNSLHFQ